MSLVSEQPSMRNPRAVLHWYDFLCPFCYIGQSRNTVLVRQINRRIKTVDETQIRSDTRTCEQEWRDFFKINCNALFQTALLLTADAVTAEVALTKTIEELDMARSPAQTSLAAWRETVVMRSIETVQLSASPPDPRTRFMLQPGLQPVIEIERFPRICFVLRMLLAIQMHCVHRCLAWKRATYGCLFRWQSFSFRRKSEGCRHLRRDECTLSGDMHSKVVGSCRHA